MKHARSAPKRGKQAARDRSPHPLDAQRAPREIASSAHLTIDHQDEASSSAQPNGLRSKSALALCILAVLIGVPYVVPALWRFRLLQPLPDGAGLVVVPSAVAPEASIGETPLLFETKDEPELRQPEEVVLPATARDLLPPSTSDEDQPPCLIEDPSGHALDAFFHHLSDVERAVPGSIGRITYFGDSIVASDFVTATLRRKLQRRFGDAGHGFMLMASPWPGYLHNDVVRFATPGWLVSRVVGPYASDGFYGLGGVSFKAKGTGAFSRFATMKEGSFGRNVSRFIVSYLEYPQGGTMEIKIDGVLRDTVATRADVARSAQKIYSVPDGPHELEVRAADIGLRAFGVVMERDTPGVVLDAIGIQGCRIRFLDKSDDEHFKEQLQLRDPSLTVFQYGMNESEDGELFPLDQYASTMKAVLQQVRAALPNASCLLVGPMDRADKKGDGYVSRPVVPKLGAIQRRVAGEVGCAYWDTLTAMGGYGSMGIWLQRGLGSADLTHPSSAGAEVLGKWIYLALLHAYADYQRSNNQAAPAASP